MFFSMSLCREVKGGWEITFHYSFVLAINAGQIIGGCWVVINDSMIIPTGSCLCLVRGQQHKNNGNRTWNHILHKVTCHHHRFLHQEVFFLVRFSGLSIPKKIFDHLSSPPVVSCDVINWARHHSAHISWYFGGGTWAKGSCHMVRRSPFR